MNEFLAALKADLLDRRLLPYVALAAAALVAGIAYVALASGGGASTPAAAPTAVAPGRQPATLVVTPKVPDTAVAEVTRGAAAQRRGSARNPFTLLPGGAQKTAATASTALTAANAAASAPSTTTTPSSSPVKSETVPGSVSPVTKAPSAPGKTTAPKKVYRVAALFGIVPAGTPPLTAQLTPYVNLKLMTALPSAKQPLLVYRGVTAGGKSATFTLVGEAILHGNGSCLPNASQCQAIDLQKDHYEQLEYLSPTGETITYELRIVSIEPKTASAASLKSELRGQKIGRELLRRVGLLEMPFLRESSKTGVLVFAPHSGFAARAHGAGHRGH
jgi:hypothetical protein